MKGISIQHLIFLVVILAITLVATGGMLYAITNGEWKVSNRVEEKGRVKRLDANEGLWIKCKSTIKKEEECNSLPFTGPDITMGLLAQRGMMMAAIAVNVLSIALAAAEFELTSFKFTAHCIAGSFNIISGVLCFAVVSWYAIDTICGNDKGIDPLSEVISISTSDPDRMYEYTLGGAIYSGFASTGVSILSGILRLVYACLQQFAARATIFPEN